MHGGSLLVAKRHSKLTALSWITLGAASSVPILVLFVHFGKLEYARPTSAAILVEIVAIKVCWELRRRFWFWLTLLSIAALHVPLIMFIAPRMIHAGLPLLFLSGAIDELIVLAVIGLIEKWN